MRNERGVTTVNYIGYLLDQTFPFCARSGCTRALKTPIGRHVLINTNNHQPWHSTRTCKGIDFAIDTSLWSYSCANRSAGSWGCYFSTALPCTDAIALVMQGTESDFDPAPIEPGDTTQSSLHTEWVRRQPQFNGEQTAVNMAAMQTPTSALRANAEHQAKTAAAQAAALRQLDPLAQLRWVAASLFRPSPRAAERIDATLQHLGFAPSDREFLSLHFRRGDKVSCCNNFAAPLLISACWIIGIHCARTLTQRTTCHEQKRHNYSSSSIFFFLLNHKSTLPSFSTHAVVKKVRESHNRPIDGADAVKFVRSKWGADAPTRVFVLTDDAEALDELRAAAPEWDVCCNTPTPFTNGG